LLAGRFNFKLETTIELLKSKTFKEKNINVIFFYLQVDENFENVEKSREKKKSQPELKNWKY